MLRKSTKINATILAAIAISALVFSAYADTTISDTGITTTGNIDITGFLNVSISPEATITIAASDSGARSKATADYTCDGTNDEVTIETAGAALPAAGGLILLLEGNFTIEDTININTTMAERIQVSGLGDSTILHNINLGGAACINLSAGWTDTADHPDAGGSGDIGKIGWSISNMQIIGNPLSGDGIIAHQTMHLRVHHLTIRDNGGDGISCVTRNRNMIITNCNIWGNDGIGIDGYHCNFHQMLISNNHISYNYNGGIRQYSTLAGDLENDDWCITGNVMEWNGDDDATDYEIQLYKTRGGSSIITGNEISSHTNSQHAIYITGDSDEVTDKTIISGNFIEDSNSHCIYLNEYCKDITITGNTIDQSASQNWGIYVDNCEFFTICGNTIDDGGIYIVDSNTFSITGNTIVNADDDGINIATGNDVFSVVGNVIDAASDATIVISSGSNYVNASNVLS